MQNKFKLIILNKRIYKEVDLPEDAQDIKIGTGKDCDVRFSKELFFTEFEILLTRNDSGWYITCDDNTYITSDGVMKLFSKDLHHGDEIILKYQKLNNDVFKINFMYDFDIEQKEYNKIIDISSSNQVTIGGSNKGDIQLLDELIENDFITLVKENGQFTIYDNNTRYGVYVNGNLIKNSKKLYDCDFFSIVGYSFYYRGQKLYIAKDSKIIINNLMYSIYEEQKYKMIYPKFNRNTRIQYIIPEEEIEIQQPVPKPKEPKKNIVLTLIPVIISLALTVVLRGILGNGGMFVIYSVTVMAVGAVMTVVNYILDKKQYRKDIAERERMYLEYIDKKENEIKAIRDNEIRIRGLIYPSVEESIKEAMEFGKRLFEKSIEDKDFLHVRLGIGTQDAVYKITFNKQEFVDPDDNLITLPEETEEKYHKVDNVPIVSKFSEDNAVGIVGEKGLLFSMLKQMTLDVAIGHFYKEVKIYYVVDEKDVDKIAWTRWLPHVVNDNNGIRNIMCDDESKGVHLEYLYSILSKRDGEHPEGSPPPEKFDVYYVIYVIDPLGLGKHPISKYIERAKDLGFTFVFFNEYEELLPKGCTEIIRLNSGKNDGEILLSADGDKIDGFTYKLLSDNDAKNVALKLSSVYIDEVSLESQLTKNITLFELLNILSIDDLDIDERWKNSQVYKTMAAPLGVKTKNEIVYLDLSDKANAHGPHGLVAGTTGSGKSEIIQTYVLAMASLFHPYDVGFVIIDFKGGGMANQFKDLPHLMGTITNIDGREIDRSLLSIKAEIMRRQALFSESDVNHINEYIKLFKAGKVKTPLPHLIMIVDEFAELKSEYPDFMKEIISAARIGRTLGVHLILATQKPAGVVDNQIWSNSKFKLCLKVQTREDSNEVIKTPLAAEIVEPGRAYFQVGNNEIFELFQSAYSGAKVLPAGQIDVKKYDINVMNIWGKRKQVFTTKKKSSDDEMKNQLQVLVEYVHDYCVRNQIEQLPGICMPPLKETVYIDEVESAPKNLVEGVSVNVGIYDDPERQIQGSYSINLSESNTFIIGSAQTGKTTMLQTIIYSLINNFTPKEVNIYIIDCGNMSLKVFEKSNFVGGVVLPAEEERVLNLFKLMRNIIAKRKEIFSEKGLGTYKAYVEAGYLDLPQIILVIDNVAAFREYYASFDDWLLSFSREGQSVGMNMLVTATQTNALGYKVLANFGNRLAFTCNDKAQYTNLFDRCRTEPREVPGRALCVMEKRVIEFHTALCTKGTKEIERVNNLRTFIQTKNDEYKSLKAMPIPEVPEIIRRSELIENNPSLYETSYSIPVGIEYSDVEYVNIDLTSIGMFGITGKEKSGKTNFVINILDTIKNNIFNNITDAYIFDSMDMQFDSVKDYPFVKEYMTDTSMIETVVDEIYDELEARQDIVNGNRGVPINEALSDKPLILLVIENRKFFEEMHAKKPLYTKFLAIMKQYKKLKIAIIFSNVENGAVAFSGPDIIKQIKENKKMFAFDDISNIKVAEVSVKQAKENSKPLKLGDAFMCFGAEVVRIKTILNE